MTPQLQQKLTLVRAWLKERIEEAESASEGPWRTEVDQLGFVDIMAGSQWIYAIRNDEPSVANARFIASSRLAAPLAYRAVLVALAILEEDANMKASTTANQQFRLLAQDRADIGETNLEDLLATFPDDLKLKAL